MRDDIRRQVAHLRMLAENYDGVDAEEFAEAADTIERLEAKLAEYDKYIGEFTNRA